MYINIHCRLLTEARYCDDLHLEGKVQGMQITRVASRLKKARHFYMGVYGDETIICACTKWHDDMWQT